MKKLLFGTMLLAMVIAVPVPMMAEVNISIGIPLPPVIVFPGPPDVIVIPGPYVYAVPDMEVDIFFWDGWWWRPWEGRWYRSRYYDRDWVYYRYVPYFYYDIKNSSSTKNNLNTPSLKKNLKEGGGSGSVGVWETVIAELPGRWEVGTWASLSC